MPAAGRLVVAAGALLALVAAEPQAVDGPRLQFADDTPADVRQLATTTWAAFLGELPGRHGCIPHVRLAMTAELDSRARYHPDQTRIVLRGPATASQLATALVHELAHHLEHHCPAHTELREPFLRAQEFAPGTPWFEGDRWESTPSEHFAEATVEAVLGYRTLHRSLIIVPEAIEVIRRWGSKEPLAEGGEGRAHRRAPPSQL